MRRVVVIALALIALAPVGVRAATWYRCAHDGELRATCCCPPQARHHAPPAPGHPVLRSACCCTITTLAARDAEIRNGPEAVVSAVDVALPVAIVVTPPLAMPTRTAALASACAPRGPPEPLFARHCTLLL